MNCTFNECDRQSLARGMCSTHYYQWYRTGSTRSIRVVIKTCKFDGCTNKHDSHGYCGSHAKQFKSGQKLRPLNEQAFCDLCGEISYSTRLCYKHYKRMSAHIRRVRIANNGIYIITNKEFKVLMNSRCRYFTFGNCDGGITIDHNIPVSRGGTHSIGNLYPVCKFHNIQKGAKVHTEYMRLIGEGVV